MTEQFCSYEIALELSELGFNDPCIAFYAKYDFNNYPGNEIKQGSLIPFIQGSEYYGEGFYLDGFNVYPQKDSNIVLGYVILAPLWQQAIDWFNSKDIIIIIGVSPTLRLDVGVLYRANIYKKYLFNQKYITTKEYFLSGEFNVFKTFEEARKQAILKAIELCKKNL